MKKVLLIIFVVLLIASGGYLGYRLYRLDQAHTALAEELKREFHRAELLKKKYAEQKARVTALQRAKLTVEGLKRQAEMKADELQKELYAQKAVIASMKGKDVAKVKALEARLAEKETILAQWKEKYDELSNAFNKAKTIIAEKNTAIDRLEANKQELESELDRTQRTRDRYFKHNHEMANIAQSILARYDEDGVFAKTILDVEPFTQIKKVELEKLIQEYLDQIDDKIIRDRE